MNILESQIQQQKDNDAKLIRTLTVEKHSKRLNEQTKSIENYSNALKKLKDQLAINKRKPESNRQFDIQYFLDSAYFALSIINDSLLTQLSKITNDAKNYEKAIKELETKSGTQINIPNTDKLDNYYSSISTELESFGKGYKVLELRVSSTDAKIQAKRDLHKEKTKDANFGAIPGLAAIFGQREVVPNITVLGSKIFDSQKDRDNLLYGELKFFTAAMPNNKDVTRASSLFIVETSSFGFSSNFSYGFVTMSNGTISDNRKLSINTSVNYLGKNLQPDSTNNFSTSLLLAKIGLEYLIVNKGSLYFNWCGLGIIDNIESFEKYYDNSHPFKIYTEFGSRFYLDLSSDANLSLKIDLNFIYQNERIKEITNTKDVLIPNVRIGLVKAIK